MIIFANDVVAGKVGSGLHGRISPNDALNRLLDGSGLIVDRSVPGGPMVRPKSSQAARYERAASPSQRAEGVEVTAKLQLHPVADGIWSAPGFHRHDNPAHLMLEEEKMPNQSRIWPVRQVYAFIKVHSDEHDIKTMGGDA